MITCLLFFNENFKFQKRGGEIIMALTGEVLKWIQERRPGARRGRQEAPVAKRLTVGADLAQGAKTNHNIQPNPANKW